MIVRGPTNFRVFTHAAREYLATTATRGRLIEIHYRRDFLDLLERQRRHSAETCTV